MFQAIFNSLSGLFSFSRSLDTVSNNVSNMNTPGFRGSDSFFSNVGGGRGTDIADEGLRTTAGSLKRTGERTDLAVDGNGFFVLRDKDGNLFYTRAGQFKFNDEGKLWDPVTGYLVMGLGEDGGLIEINLNDHDFLPAEKTSQVKLAGQVLLSGPETTIDDVVVYDAGGASHTLKLKLVSQSPDLTPPGSGAAGEYKVKVILEDGTELATEYDIKFAQVGSNPYWTPVDGFNKISVDLTFGGVPQTVEFNFGDPGAINGVFLSSFETTIIATPVDGHGRLARSNFYFDADGILQLGFGPNGAETDEGPQIALASFRSEGSLEMIDGRLIAGSQTNDVTLGRPNEGLYGRLVPGSLELANVDLTQEFAEMIIIQRGYQASSRVMTVGNEMIEQLYNSTRGG